MALIASLALADNSSPREPAGVRVTIHTDPQESIELEANQASLAHIMKEFEQATSIRVHYSALPDDPVTAKCTGFTVQEVMACLLGPDAGLVVRYSSRGKGNPARSKRPVELWVLGTRFTEASWKESPASGNALENTAATAGLADHPGTAQERTDSPARTDNPSRTASPAEENPTQRAAALSRLIADPGRDAPALRNILEQAFHDAAPEVRVQAVYGLARLGGSEAGAYLQAALHDPNADVRLMAVDSAGSDPAGLEVLRVAKADHDPTVRMLAAMKLEVPADSRPGPL